MRPPTTAAPRRRQSSARGGYVRRGIQTLGRIRRPARPESGFTLLEVMLALALIVSVLLPTTMMMIEEVQQSGNLRNRVQAADLVDAAVHAAENESFSSLIANAPPAGAPQTVTQKVGSVKYTIKTQTYWQPETTTQGGCDNPGTGGATGLEDVLLVEATASWNGMVGTPPVRADTLITPPGSEGSAQDGNLAVSVAGPAPQNTPAANWGPITVEGPSGTSQDYTDSNGCLFLGYQTPGQYTFTLNQAGWVSNEEAPVLTSTVYLTAGTASLPVPLEYSQGATILATFTGTAPAPIGLPITVANSSLTSSPTIPGSGPGTYTFSGSGSAVTSMTLQPLWPYNTGYQVFAGRCPEANPAAVGSTGSPLYSGISDPTDTVTAGQTTNVNVPLYPLTVNVVSQSSKPVSGYTIDVTEQAGTASTSCSSLQTYSFVGTTSSTGALAGGMPLGNFTVGVVKPNGSVLGTANVDITGSAATATVTIP